MTKLVFEMKPRLAAHLVMGELRLINGAVVKRWPATSGTIRNQTVKSYWTRNKGLLPPTAQVRKPYVVLTELTHSENVRATGGNLFGIWPQNVWSLDGTKVRRNLAVHLDANHASSPGSGGCIVFTKLPLWTEFAEAMEDFHARGVREIPLEVMYG